MTESDYLNGADMREQCELAKRYLNKDNEALDLVKTKIKEFIEDRENFKGKTGDALREQMNNYITLINYMKLANEIDIEDFETLYKRVGSKVLMGEMICSQISSVKWSIGNAEERAENYNALMRDTINPFSYAYYRYKKSEFDADAGIYEELYNEWKKKAERYDEIELMTRGLFEGAVSIRNIVKRALDSQGKNFDSKSKKYTNNPYKKPDWDKELRECFLNYTESTYIGLEKNSEDYLKMFDEVGGIYKYGGDQGWFKGDSELGNAISEHGCGIIALVNFFYYMEGKKNITKDEYKKRVYDFIENSFGLETFLGISGLIGTAVPMVSVESLLNTYLEKNTQYNSAKWQWNNGDYIEQIEQQLNKGIPVILGIWNKNKVTETLGIEKKSKEELANEPELPLYEFDSDYNKLKEYQTTNEHYVTVIGIKNIVNSDTYERKTYLEVSTWGKILYIDYNEFLEFKDNCSNVGIIADEINDVASNISIIE